MKIFPAIDIKNGQCVRLTQGRFDDVIVYGDDPIEVAGKWVRSGARALHIIDLDGARLGESYTNDIIKKIIKKYHIFVQTGGGIRTMRDIEEKISLGVNRVILGTVAVKKPELVNEAVKAYDDKIAVGVDAVNGRVAVEGWEELSQISAVELCNKMKLFGVKTVIYTDISKDGMMIGPNIEATKELINNSGLNVIASGGISSMMDIENVETIGAHGIIIGKALYQGALNLRDIVQRFEK